jgi:hypothetical protein
MSTIPGESTWTDAGLVPQDPDEAREAVDDVQAAGHVDAARPDLVDQADEPDVVEQAIDVPDDDADDYPDV